MKNTFGSHNSTNVTASNGFMCGYLKQILQMLIGELAVFYYYLYMIHARKHAFSSISITINMPSTLSPKILYVMVYTTECYTGNVYCQ